MVEPILDISFWQRILFSIICGAIIGIERQLRNKPIDIRTSILICLGTSLYIYLGWHVAGPSTDMTRVLGQIVTGIGFLGAGVIITTGGGLVSGVTSAAVVYLLAAIGSAIGFGFYSVALSISLVALFVLIGVEWLEEFVIELRHTPRK